jgi:hypothetical protein
MVVMLCLTLFGLPGLRAQELTEETGLIVDDMNVESEDADADDDGTLERLQFIRKHPMDINQVDEETLVSVFRIHILQARNLVKYRQWAGPLVDLHELQAIPGWNVETIRRLMPFFRAGATDGPDPGLAGKWLSGEHTVLIRAGYSTEKSGGARQREGGWAVDRLRAMIKYGYRLRDRLQWGITFEKDAGEQFWRPGRQGGVDFHSFHLEVRTRGFIRTLILGDYHINIGQGLIHWQSPVYGSSSIVLRTFQQGSRLKPYTGTDENRFHRGIALSGGVKNLEGLLHLAVDRTDGKLEEDSVRPGRFTIASFQASGLHRTSAELTGKDAVRTLTYGMGLVYRYRHISTGLHALAYRFNHPVQESGQPYQYFNITGKHWSNAGMDLSYTFSRFHFFGEWAIDRVKNLATTGGLLASLHPAVDFSISFRHLQEDYRALQAAAFTRSSLPQNETGMFTALTIRAHPVLRIDMSTENFRFPWLKYRIDAPSDGHALSLQLTWKPARKSEAFVVYRQETAALNLLIPANPMNEVRETIRRNVRIHALIEKIPGLVLKQRLDVTWYRHADQPVEKGFQYYLDLLCKPMQKNFSLSGRFYVFHTDSYQTQTYAYERDVLYYYGMSALQGIGLRYYVLVQVKILKQLNCWLKFSRTARDLVSPNDESGENWISKTDLRFQVQMNF